jgi:hypothetical protein
VGSGCLGSGDLRQLCPPHFGQRAGDKRACAHRISFLSVVWELGLKAWRAETLLATAAGLLLASRNGPDRLRQDGPESVSPGLAR